MQLPELKSSFSLTQANAWRQTPVSVERWFAPDWSMLPLAARQCRVRNPLTGAVAELDADRYAVLHACEGCHTLAEHANLVRQKLNVRAEDAGTIARWLEEFATGGLLTSLSDLVTRLDGAPDSSPARFVGVVIRTCDRPVLLRRALASAASMAQRHGHRHRYIILDDSRSTRQRAANRALLESFPDLLFTYVDLAAPTRLQQELEARVPGAHAAIEWLIGSPAADETTYGRPVNYALLMSAGERLLMLDDDAALEPRRSPIGESSGFTVSSASDELFCYRDAAALHDDCPLIDLDPIADHLDVLGHPTHSLWKRFAQAQTDAPSVSLGADDASRFAAGARVLFSQNHALGDPGSSLFPYHLLSLPVMSQTRLLRDPASLRHAFADRINWRGQPRSRLATRRPFTLTTLAGIDNSVMIPPTARSQRNEDLLLGEVAQHAHPAGWFVDLPWALPHWRDPPKTWLDASSPFAQEPIHFLMDYVGQRAPMISSEDPGERLRTIASWLRDLSTVSEMRLADLLVEQAADTATRTLFSIAAQLDSPDLPPAWKDLLRPWLDSPALSTDSTQLRTRIAPTATVRTLARNYGCALEVWPTLWNAAREIHASQPGLSE